MSAETLIATGSFTALVALGVLVALLVLRAQQAERLSRRLGLALPEGAAQREEILRRERRQTRWTLVGAGLGFLAAVGATLLVASAGLVADPGPGAVWTGVAGMLLGGVMAISRKPEQFYLRRLWPEVAAAGAASRRTRYTR